MNLIALALSIVAVGLAIHTHLRVRKRLRGRLEAAVKMGTGKFTVARWTADEVLDALGFDDSPRAVAHRVRREGAS